MQWIITQQFKRVFVTPSVYTNIGTEVSSSEQLISENVFDFFDWLSAVADKTLISVSSKHSYRDFSFPLISPAQVSWAETPVGGGNGFHMKRSGILVGSFQLNPTRRPIWAWLGLFFGTLKKANQNRISSTTSRCSIQESNSHIETGRERQAEIKLKNGDKRVSFIIVSLSAP